MNYSVGFRERANNSLSKEVTVHCLRTEGVTKSVIQVQNEGVDIQKQHYCRSEKLGAVVRLFWALGTARR